MAKPRVFISSTFFDLRHVREDMERFVRELGYEPVRHEVGSIPYGKEQRLESSAYREVEMSDIIVTIIGGRFGSDSHEEKGLSITQTELKRALDKGIQVFIFIDQNVLTEFETFRINRENREVKWRFADDPRIFEFIEKLYQLPKNNPITPFGSSKDITEYLKLQWAGLFQRFLQEQQRAAELKVLDEIKTVAGTLQQLVTYLTEERRNNDNAIESILLASHPAFRRFAAVTNTPYRVFFTTLDELDAWLGARSWKRLDSFEEDIDSQAEWESTKHFLKIKEKIFDDTGRLKLFTDQTWRDQWVVIEQKPEPQPPVEEEDIPF